MQILAIDPGPTESALVAIDHGGGIIRAEKLPNGEALAWVRNSSQDVLVVEMIESFGMAVGKEVFETVWWIGRFCEAFPKAEAKAVCRVYRKDVKLHFCNSVRAKDGNIRQAIIDRYGGPSAIGRKASKGPLYGLSGDLWQAYACGLTWLDKQSVGV